MKRAGRSRRSVLGVVLSLSVLLAAMSVGAGQVSAGDVPPVVPSPGDVATEAVTGKSVVVVMVDDMAMAELPYLPKVKSLLQDQGVTFDTAYDNTPVCCPARATLLTGQRSKNHGVDTNKPFQGEGYQALDSFNTMATWFSAAGYDTSFVGKYLNGYGYYSLYPNVADNREVPPGWKNWHALVGTARYYGFTLNRNGNLVYYPRSTQNYLTDVIADISVSAIDQSLAANKPFFLWVAPLAPHTGGGLPPIPAARHVNSFNGLALPQPPNFNEADVRDKPPFVRIRPLLDAAAIETMRAHFEARVESLQAVDDAVGRIHQRLLDAGKLDDTLIVFVSDNGYMFGNHRLEGKVRVYDESSRVAMVVRGGSFVGGKTVTVPVSNVDLAPTIVAHTGITPARVMDGLDLTPIAADQTSYTDRAIILEMVEGPGYRAIRTKQWMWIEYYGTPRELYDMVNDPYQLTSRHNDPSLASVRTQLSAKLKLLANCVGAAACDVRY